LHAQEISKNMDKIKFNGDFQDFKSTFGDYKKFPSRSLSGYLYLFQVGSHVKVGKTLDVKKRIISHNRTSILFAGKEIEKIILCGVYDNVHFSEVELRNLIVKSGEFQQLSLEWFSGDLKDFVKFL
jgi:hypothetical protein